MTWCLVKHRDNFTYTFWSKTLRRREHIGELRVDGKIILKCKGSSVWSCGLLAQERV